MNWKFIAILLLALAPAYGWAACPDVGLVLAIDNSGSIDANEFAIQQQGYAAAFRSQAVQNAMAAAGVVDVAVILWGDSEMRLQVLPWQRVGGAADAGELADRIAGLSRVATGSTGIGRGLSAAVDLFHQSGSCALRKIVNVSGDGYESHLPRALAFVPLAVARKRATDAGITVNALAITQDVASLGRWYHDRLITGPDTFVMEVRGFDSFAAAIQRKLAREVAPPMLAAAQP